MRSNLYHILVLLCLIGFRPSVAQELGKNNSTPIPVKKGKVNNLIEKKKDSTKTDSISKPKEALEDIITHNAENYTLQNTKTKSVTLYNKANVVYKDINLKSGIIIIDYKNNLVYAKGIKDSLGYHQRPVFKQGNQESEQDSITLNFKTKKAIIYGIKTVQDGIITYGEKTKRVNDSTIYMRGLRFTTSKKDIPDYYIRTNKAKLVPGKKIIVGGSNLVIADVPTPLFLPFAYFPLTKGRTSGFIIPTWGESDSQGFFLQNGGYYFVINDYVDLTLLGDLYTNGSWGLRFNPNYYVRYKYSGNFNLRLETLRRSIKGLSDFSETSNFNLQWSHSQDNKSNPNSRFSASVNLGSSQYFRQSSNEINRSQYLTNTLSSSISYYRKFVGTPFDMSLSATHSQNTNNKSITMTLPSLQVNMERQNPFEGKGGIRKNPIQKIGINYNMQGEYRINTVDSLFFKKQMFDTAKKGIQHNVNASTSMKAFKYFTISPSMNYRDVWYFEKIKKYYDPTFRNPDKTFGSVINDTINGFTRFNHYSMSVSMSTNVYGTFNFKKGRLKAIRHTIRPSISYGYTPDFYDRHSLEVRKNNKGDLLTYTPFDNGIYGSPSKGISNSIGISINNVLEGKVAPKDPDSDEEDKKITILNNLNFSSSYNFAADSLRWSPVSANAGTRLFKDKLALNINASLDPYQINEKGERIDKFNSDIFRITNASVSANYSLSSTDFDKKDKKESENKSANGAQQTPDVFGENRESTNGFSTKINNEKDKPTTKNTTLYRAKIPWNLGLTYSLTYANNGLTSGISNNSVMFSGDVEFSPKWKVGFSSGYDIKNDGFTYTSLNFSRDLDSWRFNFNWTPFGINSSYYFFIGVKSSALSDLKWDKNKPPDRVLY